MLRPQGDHRSVEGNELQAVYVGAAERGAAVAEELSDGTVTTERSGEAALARLEDTEVDCVVAEADLPDVSGTEFLRSVGDLHPDAARVLLAESVDSAPPDVTFVPTRPRAGLPARTARRVRRAVERRVAENSQDELADQFETLVEGSPDPIITIDEESQVVFANEAVERVFGHEPESLVGESVLRLLDDEVHDCFTTNVRELAADEGTVQRDYVELTGRTAEGREIPLAISFRETERDGHHYFSAIVRDVSERKRLKARLEAEKRKTNELHEVAVMLEGCDTADEVCCLAVETAEQLLEFDLCVVDMVEDSELVPQAVSKGVPSDGYYTTTPLDAEDNLAARAYREGESIRTRNLHDEGVDPAESGYRAALTVPVGDVGVFQAVAKESGAFDESDRELAELLVSHVTQALKRVQSEAALKSEKRKIRDLHEVAVMLEECETADEVSELAIETAEELLEFDRCVLDLVKDGEHVPQAVSKGLPTDDYYTKTSLDAEDNLGARAYRRDETVVTSDVHEEDVDPAVDEYRAALTVPVGDIGVFQAVAKKVGAFDESDRELAELLVSHVTQALKRIRSEAALEAERDRFAALFENVPEPIVDYDRSDGRPIVHSVNEAFEEVFGYEGDEVVGRALDDLIVPEEKQAEFENHVELIREQGNLNTEVRREAADGMRDFLLRTASLKGDGSGGYAIYTDITERKRNEERHRSMTEDVLDNTDVGIFVLDDEFDVSWANSAVEEYFGLDRDAILGADKEELIDDTIHHAVTDGEQFEETVTATYEDNTYVEEFTCHVTEGEGREERHLQHRSRPIESGLYAGGRVELYYDVTERVEREAMLDALHDATRDLMSAESQHDICETAVETARDVLDIPHATVLRWNDESGLLEPYFLPDDTIDEIGDVPSFEPGEGIAGSVYESGESEYFDNAWNDPRAHEEGSEGIRAFAAFPLGEWGVLNVASLKVGAFDDYEIDLVRVLAANAEVALNRAAREAELAEQRCQLAELDRINEVIRDVDQLLVRASTREEIEQAVCERLAESEHYRFAWTGETMAGTDAAEPTASAGVEQGYLDEIVSRRDESPQWISSRAVETGEVQVVQNIHEDEVFEPWREEALERGYRSGAAIPLRYRDTVYGVLCVYADRSNAFDEREREVLAELGETIGHAINAAENKKALVSDGVVEVEFEGQSGDGFFARVPQETGCRFELEGVTMTTDGSFVYFMTVDGLAPDAVLERASAADEVEQARLVNEHDDGNLFEFVYTGPSPLPALAEHGGTLRDAEFTEDGGRSVVEIPRNVDVRAAIESIQEAINDPEVVAQRERERPAQTVEEFRTALDEDITERQRSALEAAYYAGFFEWPRESNGEEVSESLGVSAPTFHQHLRVGERKLLSTFLDD